MKFKFEKFAVLALAGMSVGGVFAATVEEAVAQAREEGKAEALRESAPVVPPAEESPVEEASADVSPDSSTDTV